MKAACLSSILRKSLSLALLATAVGTAELPRIGGTAEGLGAEPHALALFVGEWELELFASHETFGDRGGPGVGRMTCAWGPERVWVDCDLDSRYDGLGRYVLKLLLYPTGDPDVYGVFVTNSFGGGRMYEGGWREGSLVFHDARVATDRRWERQRTTYEPHGPDELSFRIEVSSDGDSWLPHSSGTYRRR